MSQLALTRTFQYGYSPLTTACIQAQDGNYILAGKMFDKGNKASGFIVSVRSDGIINWEKTFSSEYIQFFQAIAPLPDNTFVVVGTKFWSDIAGEELIWAMRLDSAGKTLWENTYGNKSQQCDGMDVAATRDGGFIILGRAIDRTPAALTRISLLKFSPKGDLQWQRYYDGAVANAITPTRDGGYALCGSRSSPDPLISHVYVLRLDATGKWIWDRTYEDTRVYVLLDSGIVENADGHFVLVAKSVIMEIDPKGNAVWKDQKDDLDLNTVIQLSDGTYGMGGSLIVDDFDHAYVAVLDQKGMNILWDNTAITYPSGTSQIFVNDRDVLTGGGYVPFNGQQSQIFLSLFYKAQPLRPGVKRRKVEVRA